MKTKREKWVLKNREMIMKNDPLYTAVHGWNAACETILRTIKRRHKEFEGNWQHEDIEILMREIKETTKLKK
jgi:hypothetical protein